MALCEESLPSNCIMYKRQTKYSSINCEKSVCLQFECSVTENNEDTIGWEENISVGYCQSCAEGRRDCGRSDTDEEKNDVLNFANSDDDESDSAEGSEKGNSEEGKKQMNKLCRKAAWKKSQITDMVNVICNDEELVRKLIFTNVEKDGCHLFTWK